MKIHVQHSLEAVTSSAIEEVLLKIGEDLDGAEVELAFLFVTHHHEDHFPTISGEIQNRLGCQQLIGCTTGTIIAGSSEYEQEPGIVLWVMTQTDFEIQSFQLTFERDGDHIECLGVPEPREESPKEHCAIFLFCEPYSSSPLYGVASTGKSVRLLAGLWWSGRWRNRSGRKLPVSQRRADQPWSGRDRLPN